MYIIGSISPRLVWVVKSKKLSRFIKKDILQNLSKRSSFRFNKNRLFLKIIFRLEKQSTESLKYFEYMGRYLLCEK